MKTAVVFFVSILLLTVPPVGAEDWYPLEVEVWDPPFNEHLQRRTEIYVPLERAEQPWKICVSIPHLKDAYWVTVNFALVDEAKRLGVRLRMEEAGGYGNIDVQRRQIQDCMDSGADGLLVGAITETGLNDLVTRYTGEGRPVIDMINGISSTDITARAASTYWDNAYKAGRYLRTLVDDAPTRVLWFPGPQGATWSREGDLGFRVALDESPVIILETGWADTGRMAQAELINAALDRHGPVDFIVGTTVSAAAALDIIRSRGWTNQTEVLSYYYGPSIHNAIRRGKILAAPTDKQGLNARLAMDIVVRALQGDPFPIHVGAKVELINRLAIGTFDATSSIPPRGFRPIFVVDDWANEQD